MLRPDKFFNLAHTEHRTLFDECHYGWQALKRLEEYLLSNLEPALHHQAMGRVHVGPRVYLGHGSVVEEGAMIKGPAIIGDHCRILHNAYIRENVVIGDGCVVGNACEIKHSVLFNECQVPHFCYVGDSILGYRVHLGAGVKISNLKMLPGTVLLDEVDECGMPIDTGLRKIGAIIGDRSEIGCNAVLNPGSIIGKNCIIYPNVNWRGILPDHMIVKNRAPQDIVVLRPRETV